MAEPTFAAISPEIVKESRKLLLDYIGIDSIHIHLYSGAPAYWRFCFQNTPLCHTFRCFKLKIKRFRRDT